MVLACVNDNIDGWYGFETSLRGYLKKPVRTVQGKAAL
jgi:hypothetical protein